MPQTEVTKNKNMTGLKLHILSVSIAKLRLATNSTGTKCIIDQTS